MGQDSPPFSIYTRSYTWFFLFCFCFLPLWIVAAKQNVLGLPSYYFWLAVAWPVLVTALLRYAASRCASTALSYADGLFTITATMTAGWNSLAIFVTFPALVIAVGLSVLISVYGDLRGDATLAPKCYYRIVLFFYRNRLRQ